MYYAWTCPYGRVSASSSVKPKFWAFSTREERDDFVSDNCVDSVGNCVCDECTRAEMTEYIGTQFLVSENGRVYKAYRYDGRLYPCEFEYYVD